MTGELMLQKALMPADGGDEAGAEELLRSLINLPPEGLLGVRALVVLGELMHPSDPEGAQRLFADARDLVRHADGADDLRDVE
ncbi:hypothetical protein ACIFOC_01248 [Leucobacter aridicollis]|uniref:hypothetical protein n=1 Tax=Leucobacter aridicollis TaxID=283878 RepID=UPI0037C963AB